MRTLTRATLLLLTLFGCLYLTTREDPLAPLACAATGFGTALGFFAVHIAPD